MGPFNTSAFSKNVVKERHAELDRVREYFQTSKQRYGDSPQDYLHLYQSLFSCVRLDTVAWASKPTPANKSKLEDAGAVLRLVVEKTVQQLDREGFAALRNQILHASVHQRELVEPLALNYAKILNTALSYTPHLEHLKSEQWIQLVFRCFDVLLGNKIDNITPLNDDFDSQSDVSDLDAGDDMDVDPTTSSPGPSTSRKRTLVVGASSSVKRRKIEQGLMSMSKEQREYATVLRQLFTTTRCHLLNKAIFKKYEDPELEPEGYDLMKRLQKGVLRRFIQFFSTFPRETSAHEDIFYAMNAALFDLELNAKDLVTQFGIDVLPSLMDIWGIRSKAVKEQLIITVRLLFPFVSHPSVSDVVGQDRVYAVWRRLEDEAESRGGLEPLPLEALRLELVEPHYSPTRVEEVPFRKTTFRNGYELTPSQVVIWSAMELHADCLSKLHADSEVAFGAQDDSTSKRHKRDNPVKSFLSNFESSQDEKITRIFQLQYLLFFIDRYWKTLHAELQSLIHRQLTHLVSDLHVPVQSWAMLCLAAIAAQPSHVDQQLDWINVWSLSMRRVSTPETCRAACHLLHIMLKGSLLDSRRILTELEDFSKELDVQGPTFPYDSVCSFLSECLRMTSQDATLHRMQIEDKTLAWLQKNWNMVTGTARAFTAQTKVEAHAVSDLLSLLAAICQLRASVSLDIRILPPDCATTSRLLEEQRSKVERDFLLHAVLPLPDSVRRKSELSLSQPSDSKGAATVPTPMSPGLNGSAEELAFPSPRERRCSSFLQHGLDNLLQEWPAMKDAKVTATAEQIRRSCDIATLCLAWEAILTLNGTRFTRKIIQSSSKLLDIIAPLFVLKRWTNEHRAVFLLGLDPLVTADPYEAFESKDVFSRPGPNSGIRRDMLALLLQRQVPQNIDPRRTRLELQKSIWCMADLQDASTSLLAAFRKLCLSRLDGDSTGTEPNGTQDDEFDQPVFQMQATVNVDTANVTLADSACVDVSIAALTRLASLRSQNGDHETDPALLGILLGDASPRLFLFYRQLFQSIRREELLFTTTDAETLFDTLNDFSRQYRYGRSESFWICVVDYLDCCLPIWLAREPQDTKQFFVLAVTAIRSSQAYNFRQLPHATTHWLHQYVAADPHEIRWRQKDESDDPDDDRSDMEDDSARSILEQFSTHGDFRIRFKVGSYVGHLFQRSAPDIQPLDDYSNLFDTLPSHPYRFEDMLTRTIVLGNIMVPNSEVRRAPYWALISTCLEQNQFVDHVHAIFMVVSALLGMDSLVHLFRPYAAQLAFSAARQEDLMDVYDLTKLPKLFGYSNRTCLASDCFLLMGPVFMATSKDPDDRGGSCFRSLCASKGVALDVGMRECLPKTLGLKIAFFINNAVSLEDPAMLPTTEDITQLSEGLVRHAQHCGMRPTTPAELLSGNLVPIVHTILGLLIDVDFTSPDALYVHLIGIAPDLISRMSPGTGSFNIDSSAAISTFRAFLKDTSQDFHMHRPILPAVSSLTILRSLLWLDSQCGEVFSEKTVYHVVTELFALASGSSMVNEQVRYLRAVMLYVSLCGSRFALSPVLRVLMRGASSLIGQIDVARSARNFLNWGLQLFLKIGRPDEVLPSILLRIGRAIQAYKSNALDLSVTHFSSELDTWIATRMSELYANSSLQESVRTAVILWPDGPQSLFPFCDVSLSNVEDVLRNDEAIPEKIALVGYVATLAQPGYPDTPDLSKAGFWQIKAALHSATNSDIENCLALSNLLFAYSCRLEAVEMDTRLLPIALTKYLQEIQSQRRKFRPLDRAIFLLSPLIDLLSDERGERRLAAYATLRRLILLLPEKEEPKTLSRAALAELSLLRSYPLPSYQFSSRSLDELADPASTQKSELFPEWVSFVTVLLAEVQAPLDPIWAQAVPVLQTNVTFAERVFPPLVHAVLQREAVLEAPLQGLIRAQLSAYFRQILSFPGAATASVRLVIDTVLYLRNFEVDEKKDLLSHDKWLDLDFRRLAQCAASYGAYTTALLLHELAEETESQVSADTNDEDTLYTIYSHIEEPDGFYAIKTRDIRRSVVRSAEHEGQWGTALGFHGSASQNRLSAVSSSSAETSSGIVRSLQSLGFDHLAISLLRTLNRNSITPELEYTLGWRTEAWDLPVTMTGDRPSSMALYLALRAVHRERRMDRVDTILKYAFLGSIDRLRDVVDDDMASVLNVSTTILCLREVHHWQQPIIQRQLRSRSLEVPQWTQFVTIPEAMEFSVAESLVTTRVSLLRAAQHLDDAEQIGDQPSPFSRSLRDLEKQCLLGLAECARGAGNVQVALNAVSHAQQLEAAAGAVTVATSKEFAHVLWLQGEKKLAIDSLSLVVREQLQLNQHQRSTSASTAVQLAVLQAQLGSWISEAGLDEATNVNRKYFQPAIEALQTAQADGISFDYAAVFHQYAMFADAEYRTIATRDLSRLRLYIVRKEQEIEWYRRQGYDDAVARVQQAKANKREPKKADLDLIARIAPHRKRAITLRARDQKIHDELVNANQLFLRRAMEMLSKVLRFSDMHDEDAAVRLLARWFSNFDNEELNDTIAADLQQIPSHKLLFLVHQLSARMQRTAVQSNGQRNLQSLMLRICRDHPFHSLYQVFALQGLKKTKMAAASQDDASQQARLDAATFIQSTLQNHRTAKRRTVAVFEACAAYLQWANYAVKKAKLESGKRYDIPTLPEPKPYTKTLLDLRNHPIPVTTAHTPVDKTNQYNDIVTIEKYERSFTVAGGVNCPKINICRGSDGRGYKQLFKGEGGDDLRQDAVMEQVFDMVNHLLQRDKETKRRRLQIRTYKVYPLAAQAGMLEFVENTSPLGSWLQVAHARYNKDPSTADCRNLYGGNAEAGIPPEERYTIFEGICREVRPVMRHYFTEKQKIPAAWFAMRLRYARSVAVTSIVGHLLGLGDRHLSNILIDNHSGEVVHIDLGIAFEQGTLLAIPETVPFRLTRDIVDGLGTTGTDGVFQRCAENTLRVLRDESDHIKTILEVFRWDPLYSWTASPFHMAKAQGLEITPPSTSMPPSTAGSEMPPSTAMASARPTGQDAADHLDMESDIAKENADRALKSVADKLDKSLSVEYTVNRLINEASDMRNLSRIYSGWLPWY